MSNKRDTVSDQARDEIHHTSVARVFDLRDVPELIDNRLDDCPFTQ
jgi:hypothetical protein